MSHLTKDDVYPQWYHKHGCKMRVRERIQDPPSITLASNAAKVVISLMENVPGEVKRRWKVEWSILFGFRSSGNVKGELLLITDDQLKAAFGIIENPVTESHSRWLIDRYGADWADQGFAIRKGCHVNIPGPGTSNDGDPNISICSDEDVKTAIVQLLSFLAD